MGLDAAGATIENMTARANMMVLSRGQELFLANMTSSFKVVIIILMVVPMLTGARQQKKILKPVISFVAIQVVNLLGTLQFATKFLLHKIPMLVDLFAEYRNLAIAVAAEGSAFVVGVVDTAAAFNGFLIPHLSHALKRAVFGFSDTSSLDIDFFVTDQTVDNLARFWSTNSHRNNYTS